MSTAALFVIAKKWNPLSDEKYVTHACRGMLLSHKKGPNYGYAQLQGHTLSKNHQSPESYLLSNSFILHD